MLAPPDRALAQRDSALRGLPLLLDPEALARALALAGSEIGGLTATYVRYKPGTNCLVAYRGWANGAEGWLYAKAHPMGARDKLAKASERGGALVLDEHAVVVYRFPQDAKLAALARLGDDGERRALLKQLLPARPEFWDASVQGLRYKPERRYVAALTVGGAEQALLKVYTPAGYAVAARNARALAAQQEVRVARRLGRSARRGALLLEWLRGRSLEEAMREPSFDPAAVAAVGAALAALHRLPVETLAPMAEQEGGAAALRAAAAAVGALEPSLGSRAHRLAARLARGLERAAAPRLTHGDFSADQVLLGEGRVALLDLDNAGPGDPLSDLGTFLAQLRWDRCRGQLAPAREEAVAAALVGGYRAAGGAAGPLALHGAAALLRLAAEPFRRREAAWPAQMVALLENAEAMEAHDVPFQ